MLQEEHLNKADVGAIGTAFLAFFDFIPWPNVAAFLAAVYTLIRIMGMVWKWWKNR